MQLYIAKCFSILHLHSHICYGITCPITKVYEQKTEVPGCQLPAPKPSPSREHMLSLAFRPLLWIHTVCMSCASDTFLVSLKLIFTKRILNIEILN